MGKEGEESPHSNVRGKKAEKMTARVDNRWHLLGKLENNASLLAPQISGSPRNMSSGQQVLKRLQALRAVGVKSRLRRWRAGTPPKTLLKVYLEPDWAEQHADEHARCL